MKILIVDDLLIRHNKISKDYNGHEIFHAYTFAQACAFLDQEQFDLISLDHDLHDFSGDNGKELKGYDVALYLVRCVSQDKWPEYVIAHTQNNVGAFNITQLVSSNGINGIIKPFKG